MKTKADQLLIAGDKVSGLSILSSIPNIGSISSSLYFYILEGGHRFDALKMLGIPSFPALVVKDLDSLKEHAE